MRFIKWCHFQWPWTNPNPVFKVTLFFDAEYLTNGYIYAHSYYRRRIGNRTKLSNDTTFNDLEWPLSQIQGHNIIQRQITWKWYKTSSSVVAMRPRDAPCLSVISFNDTKRRVESFIVSYVGYRLNHYVQLNALFCCLWRNFEASCHKHFVVFCGN